MPTLRNQPNWLIGLALALALVVTRNHQWTASTHLPDASLAIFFIVGARYRSWLLLPTLMALCFGIDAWAVGPGGVSSYCITPAYGFLIPAYTTLWLGGRLFARTDTGIASSLIGLLLIGALATGLSELFSSGGFYFLSGRFHPASLVDFIPRLARYSPGVVTRTLLYLLVWFGAASLAGNLRPSAGRLAAHD